MGFLVTARGRDWVVAILVGFLRFLGLVWPIWVRLASDLVLYRYSYGLWAERVWVHISERMAGIAGLWAGVGWLPPRCGALWWA